MKKKKIFIVDESIDYIHELCDQLTLFKEIDVCGYALNGEEALKKIKKEDEIDILVINTILSYYDGVEVLNIIKSNQLEYPTIKLIFALSPIINDYIANKVSQVGVHHLISKANSINTIVNHMKLEFKQNILINKHESVSRKITRLIHSIGIPAHVRGYHFIREAIELCLEDPLLIGQVTKSLYPEIAKKYNSSGSKVERAIRHAIEIGWNRGSYEAVNEIFGNTISLTKAKPTNSEFIAMLTDYVLITQNELEEQKIGQ